MSNGGNVDPLKAARERYQTAQRTHAAEVTASLATPTPEDEEIALPADTVAATAAAAAVQAEPGIAWRRVPDSARRDIATFINESDHDVDQLAGVPSDGREPLFAVTFDEHVDSDITAQIATQIAAELQLKMDAKARVKAEEKSVQEAKLKETKKELEEASEAVATNKRMKKARWGRSATGWSTTVLVLLGLVAAFTGAVRASSSNADAKKADGSKDRLYELADQWAAFAWAGGVTVVLLLLVGLVWIRPSNGSVIGLFVGKDNRLSTSLFQVLLWTTVVVFAFLMFVFQLAYGVDLGDDNDGFAGFDETYLFLLGGPFAAAVLAKFTATLKSEDESTQQAPADKPAAKDLASDNSGVVSLTDVQFLLFNFVALAYFCVLFAKDPSTLPSIEPTLVGLTSISALTYIGGKVVNSNPPTVTSVSILSGGSNGKLVPGQTLIRIVGKNFQPSETDEDKDLKTALLIGATEVTDLTVTSDSELQAQVPMGLGSGATTISVRTAEGSTATPWSGLEIA